MIWPLRRLWCEVRGGHPTKLWASEWTFSPDEKSRTLQSRCSDCGWVRYVSVERLPRTAKSYAVLES